MLDGRMNNSLKPPYQPHVSSRHSELPSLVLHNHIRRQPSCLDLPLSPKHQSQPLQHQNQPPRRRSQLLQHQSQPQQHERLPLWHRSQPPPQQHRRQPAHRNKDQEDEERMMPNADHDEWQRTAWDRHRAHHVFWMREAMAEAARDASGERWRGELAVDV